MTALIGRDSELVSLKQHLTDAMAGKGSTVLISGEPGIGKTRLVEEFRKHADAENVRILSGAAMSGSAHPFQIFSKALEGLTDKPLFEEQEYTTFAEIFAVNSAGLLLAKASSEEGGLDADIFAGMLSAVQDFVHDSFGGGGKAGLGRLEYGDMKILIEHGQHLFLTAVFSGTEHPDMKNTVRQALRRVEESHGQRIAKWSGKMSEIAPIQDDIERLAKTKFIVRKSLEGIKLDSERIKIADRVLELLGEVSRDQPLVLLLEDLHWADESSLFVLNYMARNIGERNVLMLGTARIRESEIFDSALERMKADNILAEMELSPLEKIDAARIIEIMFPENEFPQNFIDSLVERCGGIPLFVVEFLKHMSAEEAIAKSREGYVLKSDNYAIPDSLESVIQNRLDALDQNAMTMAEYASCLGRTFSLPVALSISVLEDGESAIKNLEKMGIITIHDNNALFTNAMFHVSLYDSISSRWKSVHHRSIGEYYEREFRGRENDVVYELANHFYRGAKHAEAAKYGIKAGEKAEASYAMEQAVTFYRHSIESLEKLPNNPETEDRNCELGERLGDIIAIIGKYNEAEESYNSSLNASDNPVTRARIFRKIAVVYEKMGDYGRAFEILDLTIKSLVGQQDPERARIAIGISIICKLQGKFDAALEWLSDAETELKKYPRNTADILEVLNTRGVIEWRRGNLDEALDNMLKADQIASDMSDIRSIARLKTNLGNVYNDMGNQIKSQEMMEAGLELFKKIGDVQAQAILLNNIGSRHSDAGNLNKALECFSIGLKTRRRIGDRKGIAYTLNNIGNQLKFQGEFEKAREHFLESRAILVSIGDRVVLPVILQNLADCSLVLGDRVSSRELINERMEIERSTGNKVGEGSTLISMAELLLIDSSPEKAVELARESISILEEAKVKIDLAMAYRILGMCHRDVGDFDAAAESFQIAKKMFNELSAKKDLARTVYEEAMLMGKMKRKQESGEALNKAQVLFQSMGMKYWADKCRKALEEL